MLSQKTQLKLANAIYSIAESETRTEVVRQVLAEKELFEPYKVYRKLSSNNGAYVTSADILKYMKDNNLNVNPKEAFILLKLFDTDGDGKLSFTEFLNGILPRDDSILRQKCTIKSTHINDLNERLPYDVEYGVSRIFEEEINIIKIIEKFKQELINCIDFNPLEAFRCIETENIGFITPRSISDFMNKIGKPIEENEVNAFFRRVDKNLDNKISYPEFLEAFYVNNSLYNNNNNNCGFVSSEDNMPMIGNNNTNISKTQKRDSSPLSSSILSSKILNRPSQGSPSQKIAQSMMKNFNEGIKNDKPTAIQHKLLNKKSPASTNISSFKKFNSTIKSYSAKSSPIKTIDKPPLEKIETGRELYAFKTPSKINKKPISQNNNNNNNEDEVDTSQQSHSNNLKLNQTKLNNDLINMKLLSIRKPSPLKPQETDELVGAFRDQINYNRELENLKNELALKRDFNIFDAFGIFDIKAKGYITLKEFEVGLNKLSLTPTKDQLHLIIKRLDRNLEGNIKFADFSSMLMPKTDEYLNRVSIRASNFINTNKDEDINIFSMETMNLFQKVLLLALENEIKLEKIRQKLARRPLFNLHDAFSILDINENGYITINEFKTFLEDHGIFATIRDLNCLIERYIRNIQGKVSYSDFVREFAPKMNKNMLMISKMT